MKKIITILAFLSLTIAISAQSITLGVDNEYCPNVDYEFTVTLPGPYHSISATQMLITQQPTSFNQSNTSFKFKARFTDVNVKQFVEIRYNPNGSATFKPEYKKVKSLFHHNPNSCGLIQPKFTNTNTSATVFNAPLCQVTTFNISFTPAKWFTVSENPVYCFGSIADYEYLLPANWKLGQSTSNGTTWLSGGNTASITSDLTTGNNAQIRIRPRNTCGSNLSNNQIPVVIFVSRNAANLTMSALPNSMACGSTEPVNFTINAPSISGITGYTWNLGNDNNWFYQGSPAQPTITTTSNTITLTPVCGAKISSPTGTVNVSNSGNNCNLNIPAATFTIASPSLSIQGSAAICSGTQNYSLLGFPCNATNIWSIEPSSGIARLNSNIGANTSISRETEGNIILNSKVTACGTEYPVTLPIKIGNYSASDYSLTGNSTTTQPLYWCPNQSYAFSVSGPGASNFLWEPPPTGWSVNYQSNYLNVLKAPTSTSPPTGTVSVSFTEPCGSTISKSFYTAYSPSACTGGADPRFTYAPNPAPYNLNVAVAPIYASNTKIYRIQINNTNTGALVFDQYYGSQGVTSTAIYTYSFQSGTYTLRIFDGSTWASYQFLK
jgi:hypothetical protein